MALTTLGDRKTPSRPVEITLDPELGLPSANQEVCLIGHRGAGAASGSSGVSNYTVIEISNVSDFEAAQDEAETKFGVGSELAKMVMAAVKANEGGSTFPALKCIALANADVGFGTSDAAITALKRTKAEFAVSPYDGEDDTLRGKISDAALAMSGAERVHNNQFGTFGVVVNRDVADPANLPVPDTQYLIACYLRDSGSPTYSLGELAAACAAKIAANAVPFNPLDNETIVGVDAPSSDSDWISVGAGLESETVLEKGWTPLRVKSNGEVAFVRTVTTRITIDGSTAATAYYDVQDFQVLYFWRKTVFTRLSQVDFTQVKATQEKAKDAKSELLRLAKAFEDQTMFQAVDKLAPQFVVERSASDRHRFDVVTPVNVVPGLHVIATNVRAGTQFDTFSV